MAFHHPPPILPENPTREGLSRRPGRSRQDGDNSPCRWNLQRNVETQGLGAARGAESAFQPRPPPYSCTCIIVLKMPGDVWGNIAPTGNRKVCTDTRVCRRMINERGGRMLLWQPNSYPSCRKITSVRPLFCVPKYVNIAFVVQDGTTLGRSNNARSASREEREPRKRTGQQRRRGGVRRGYLSGCSEARRVSEGDSSKLPGQVAPSEKQLVWQ